MNLKTFEVKGKLIEASKRATGAYTFILDESSIDLKEIYGRDNLCLKVFRKEPIEGIYYWGDVNRVTTTIIDASMIQNVFAFEGLAPRVYDLILLKDEERIYMTQVTEFLEGEKTIITPQMQKAIVKFSEEKFIIYRSIDMNKNNSVGGKYIDFQTFFFNNKEKYEKRLINLINTYAAYGSKEESYQAVEELNVPGQRNMEHRLEIMGIDDIDFKGKTVLDLGCTAGIFCHDALKRGAKRVVGIDLWNELLEGQRELANYLGHWNIDFYRLDLRNEPCKNIKEITGMNSFDIIYFLSMVQHTGFPEYIGELCNEAFLFEGHVAMHHWMFEDDLKKHFSKVENRESSHDSMARPVFRCFK